MDSRERLAENEALFRSLNENTVRRAGRDGEPVTVHSFVCECSRYNCFGEVRLGLTEYKRVRSDPTRFVLLPGHEVDGIEGIVESHPGFNIVDKHGVADEVARERAREDAEPP